MKELLELCSFMSTPYQHPSLLTLKKPQETHIILTIFNNIRPPMPYYLSQNIYRFVNTHGLTNVYKNNQQFKKLVRSLSSLAFLPIRMVQRGFDLIVNDFNNMNINQGARVFGYFKK